MAWYSADGEPVQAGEFTVTPRSRILSVRMGSAAFAWQIPTRVLVERGGMTHSLPILDVTRIAQATLFALAALLFLRSRA
jgi:hypothetical protein